MSTAISDAAREVLRAAGWHEGRHVDTEPLRRFLTMNGYDLPPIADEFLREFHEVRVAGLGHGGLAFVHFDVRQAAARLEEEDKPFLDALVKVPLCPVGYGGGSILFLTPAGEMVSLNDQWFGYTWMPTIADGVDAILGIRRSPQQLGVDLASDQKPPEFR